MIAVCIPRRRAGSSESFVTFRFEDFVLKYL
jgi:hypothetical protein